MEAVYMVYMNETMVVTRIGDVVFAPGNLRDSVVAVDASRVQSRL
jgi:hypothetical protein